MDSLYGRVDRQTENYYPTEHMEKNKELYQGIITQRTEGLILGGIRAETITIEVVTILF